MGWSGKARRGAGRGQGTGSKEQALEQGLPSGIRWVPGPTMSLFLEKYSSSLVLPQFPELGGGMCFNLWLAPSSKLLLGLVWARPGTESEPGVEGDSDLCPS